jgi:tripartite-type tricarboxylate transporter receptor subunit TctC
METTVVRSPSSVRRRTVRRSFLAMGLATPLCALLRNDPARADTAWPARTVRLFTLAAPGAGTDAVARTVADALPRRWRQPVIVDNRPGGEGIVSIEAFLAREGNHALLFNPAGVWTTLALIHERLPFDVARELIPLSFVAQDFIALVASPRLGAVTLADIVAMARAQPGTLTWASAPSVPFLAFTSFAKAAGLELTYVPYRNPIAALPDLAEGRVDLAFLPLAPLIGPAQAGKLRLVVVASDERAPLAPDLATAKEAGFPALSFLGGHCLFGPKEMPAALRERIAADVREIIADPDVARRLLSMGYRPRPESTAELNAFLEGERTRWTEVAQKYGAKPTP